MSTATITGRLVADAELKWTTAGKAVLSARIADNHRKKVGDKWEDDSTTMWGFTLWEQDAETYIEILTKGTEVVVTGEPRVREFERADGTKGKAPEIHRATVGIRKRPARTGGTPGPRASTQQADDPWAAPAQAAGGYSDVAPF